LGGPWRAVRRARRERPRTGRGRTPGPYRGARPRRAGRRHRGGLMDALTRYQALVLVDRVREQRAAVTATPAAGGAVEVVPCTECEEDAGEVLVSPDRAVVDGPVTAAATMVRSAVVFPAEHFEKWDANGREQTPLTVEPDGRIYGHIAGEGCYRNGNMRSCKRYQPDPDPKLRNFHTWTTT